jgi:hypothetical protein
MIPMRLHWLARLTGLLAVVLLNGCPKGGGGSGGETTPADTAATAKDSTATDTTP